MIRISIDNPHHTDTLGRIAFARHLLDVVERLDVEAGGAVVGLEGSWGSGKTSVLNSLGSLAEERAEVSRPILIRFNPWMVSGTPGLVEALLLQIAAELPSSRRATPRLFGRIRGLFGRGTRAATLAASLIEYASVLGTIKHFAPAANILLPGTGFFLEAIGQAAESASDAVAPTKGVLARLMQHPAALSLNGARQQVERRLRELARRVVVLVDDLDRLPPNELAVVIQAVKAVADFPSVVYVLAYDPVVAAHAVEAALQVDSGLAFLEKIVQVPLQLPEIPARKLTAFATERLKSSIRHATLTKDEQSDLLAAWILSAALMQSPRDVERLRTRLLVASPVLEGEVNMADIVLLEALALKCPKVLMWIQGNVDSVISAGLGQYDEVLTSRGQLGDPMADVGLDPDKRRERESQRSFDWATLLAADPRSNLPVREAMAFLFDRCRPDWARTSTRSNFRRVQEYRAVSRPRCNTGGQ